MVCSQSLETEIAMVKRSNAGGRTKRANERSIVYSPPAWRRWRNVKTTYCWMQSIKCFISSRGQIHKALLCKDVSSVLFFSQQPIVLICQKTILMKHFNLALQVGRIAVRNTRWLSPLFRQRLSILITDLSKNVYVDIIWNNQVKTFPHLRKSR